MEFQGQTRKFIPKVVTPIPVDNDEKIDDELGFGGANLELIYRDLYNFQMCTFCGIPTDNIYCSESCFVSDMKSS